MKTVETFFTATGVALSMYAGACFAEDSATIYGVLDLGLQRNTNVNGLRTSKEEVRHEPSYWGIKGTEDLGGGLQAFFVLEQTVSIDTGVASGFRQSLVGFRNADYGSIGIGRQFDPVVDIVAVDPPRWNSITAVHPGDYDRTAGIYFNNSIKYRSPSFHGFSGSVAYGFKEDGSSSTNAGKAAGGSVNYIDGGLRVSAVYFKIDGVVIRPYGDVGMPSLLGVNFARETNASILVNDRIAGIGGYYDIAGVHLMGDFVSARLEANGRSATMRTTAFAAYRDLTTPGPRPGFGASYSAMEGSHWTNVYAILDYNLSKRTDIYARVVHQRAGGPAGQVAALFLEGPSSTNRQTVFGVGMTQRF